MQSLKIPLRHLFLRLLILPVLIALFYLILMLIKLNLPSHITELRVAVYAAAAITALSLMAEAIILFGRKRYDKLVCNLTTILIVIFFIVFTVQSL